MHRSFCIGERWALEPATELFCSDAARELAVERVAGFIPDTYVSELNNAYKETHATLL